MTSIQNNPNDMFWLARYAHNQLAPLFAQAKAIEPTIEVSIEMTFADEESKFSKDSHIGVNSHWARDGMFQHSTWMRTQADVDFFAAKLAADVAKLAAQVPA